MRGPKLCERLLSPGYARQVALGKLPHLSSRGAPGDDQRAARRGEHTEVMLSQLTERELSQIREAANLALPECRTTSGLPGCSRTWTLRPFESWKLEISGICAGT